jgi:dihydrodipicolinate synthase/N-acetylneuraminate lyase
VKRIASYAKYAASIGADAVQVMLPGYGDTDTLFAHFKAVASAIRKPLVLHGQASFELLARLISIESLAAFKEEYQPLYTVQVFHDYGDRLNIFGGGGKSRAIQYRPYGMKAYYSAFSTFALPIAMGFWEALRTDDFAAARRIESRYEVPYRKHFSHAWWRATLEHFGVAKRYLRPPERFFSNREMAQVREFYSEMGLG